MGIAFQSLKNEDAENCGYVIPTPVVDHFIRDYEKNEKYTGFPGLGIEYQSLENDALRRALGMKKDQKGVLISRVNQTSPSAECIRRGDILLEFEGVEIANDGTVSFRSGERINFTYLVSKKFSGETARVRILRNKQKPVVVRPKLLPPRRLVPIHIKGESPSYLIIAGLFFTPVSRQFLKSEYGKDYNYEAPVHILRRSHEFPKKEGEQVVVLSSVLPARVNVGYEDIVNTEVLAFNGTKVENLFQLATLLEQCREEYMRFDLEFNQVVVLQTEEARESTEEILQTHLIPSRMSADVEDHLKVHLMPTRARKQTGGRAERKRSKGGRRGPKEEEEVGDMAVVVEQGEQVKEFPKPSGRAPRNCVWDAEVGKWWDEVQEIHRERKPRSKRSKRSKSKEPPQATNSNP